MKIRKENAYFTVEAALVLPVVIGTLLFAVYLFVFQYNRCLLEQDMGAMALWGSCEEETETEAFDRLTRERMTGMYKDKYVAWYFTEMKAELRNNHFSVKSSAQLKFPFSGWNFWSRENIWGAEAVYEYRRFSPVTFIRLCRKLGREKTPEEQ